jgi:hypothetical protein
MDMTGELKNKDAVIADLACLAFQGRYYELVCRWLGF